MESIYILKRVYNVLHTWVYSVDSIFGHVLPFTRTYIWLYVLYKWDVLQNSAETDMWLRPHRTQLDKTARSLVSRINKYIDNISTNNSRVSVRVGYSEMLQIIAEYGL